MGLVRAALVLLNLACIALGAMIQYTMYDAMANRCKLGNDEYIGLLLCLLPPRYISAFS